MPSTPPSEPAVTFVPIVDHLVVRPFIDAEKTTSFENQPVPRPVLDVDPTTPTTLKVLDPALKYKVKREVSAANIHWFPPDGDDKTSPVPAATAASATSGTADLMARHIFDGFNTTTVVVGHAKSGKMSLFLGDSKDTSESESKDDKRGLVVRFAYALFETLAKKPSNSTVSVALEIVEMDDGHTVTDLLLKKPTVTGPRHQDPEPIKIKEEAYGAVAAGATRVPVANTEAFLATLKPAVLRYKKSKQQKASTHLVICVRCVETLTFADPLNPNEQITKTGYANATFALVSGRPTAFFRCVDTAAQIHRGETQTAKVPIRESNLTRLVQDFFGGNSFAQAFTCLSPYHGHAKDVLVMLDIASKINAIKCVPKQSYDETTSEFRRLDKEVNNLNSELSAATEAHVIVQNELNSRQAALIEAQSMHAEQSMALDDLQFTLAAELTLISVRKMRMGKAHAAAKQREADLAHEVESADSKSNGLDAHLAAAVAALAAHKVAEAVHTTATAEHEARASEQQIQIDRYEARYEEVRESKNGLGGVKDELQKEHDVAIANKPDETAAFNEEAAVLNNKVKELEMPVRMAQMACDSINELRKRVQAAKDKQAELTKEEEQLNKAISDLEKEVAQMEIDAQPDPSCCVVM